ncbi:calcium-binding protein, partial [Lutimaribacter marinistellae]
MAYITGDGNLSGTIGDDTIVSTGWREGSSVPPGINGRGGSDTITGTNSSDNIWGDGFFDHAEFEGDDYIDAMGGQNRVWGGGGNDTILTGDGYDTIHGDDGYAADGDDEIHSGGGNDSIEAGDGDDSIRAGTGFDDIKAGEGNDTVFGGDHGDEIWGLFGDDRLYGEAGDDWIDGYRGRNYLSGGDGEDTIWAGGDTDTIFGGDGFDTILFNTRFYEWQGGDLRVLGVPGEVHGGGFSDTIVVQQYELGNDPTSGGYAVFDFRNTEITSIERLVFENQKADDVNIHVVLSANQIDNRIDSNPTSPVITRELASDLRLFGLPGSRAREKITIEGRGVDIDVSGWQFFDFVNVLFDLEIFGNADPEAIRTTPFFATLIEGGDGGDTVHGSDHGDTIHGDDGDDSVHAGAGRDEIDGGPGNDTLRGEAGNDTLLAGLGSNLIDGGADTDFADYSNIGDVLTANLETGEIVRSAGTDTVLNVEIFHFGSAAEEIIASSAADSVFSGYGDDTILGIGGSDTINGGNGDDRFVVTSGFATVLDGGLDEDTIVPEFDMSATTQVSLRDGFVTIPSGGFSFFYTWRNFEHYDSSLTGGAEQIEGTESANRILAGSGANVIDALGGDDTVHGGEGADTVNGGDGHDDLDGGADTDRVTGGLGDDTIRSDDDGGFDAIYGGSGTDSFDGSVRTDDLVVDLNAGDWGARGVGGVDMFSIEAVATGSGDDLIVGFTDSTEDTLRGNGGNDTIIGSNDAELIEGGPGADEINGGGQSDTLVGGAGDDTILGGTHGVAGDTAVFSQAGGQYTALRRTDGALVVQHRDGGAATDGIDTLFDVEHLQFADGIVAVDAIADNAIAETGSLFLSSDAVTVSLQRSYVAPVVVAFVSTENGFQPVNVRVSGVSGDSLTLRLQEPNYLDGSHFNETVHYMVVEEGTWVLPDGTLLEAGTLQSNLLSSQGFESVAFEAEFDTAPVILSQVQSANGADFVTTRQRSADAEGF